MNTEEISKNLSAWRRARGAESNFTFDRQYLAFLESMDDIGSAIGQCVLRVINAAAASTDFSEEAPVFINDLMKAAEVLGLNIDDCTDDAWSDARSQIGLYNSSGIFVEWPELTHEERLTVASRGQLVYAPASALRECLLCCTPHEWQEIVAAELKGCGKKYI